MSMFTSMLYLLDNAEADGVSIEPDKCQFVVDREAFWKEIDREQLHTSEPLMAFGHYVYLRSGLGHVELRCLDELGHDYDAASPANRYVPTGDWQLDADGDETLRQMAWRMYKKLPEVMKDPRWANLIFTAETMQQMTELYLRVEALRRASNRLSHA